MSSDQPDGENDLKKFDDSPVILEDDPGFTAFHLHQGKLKLLLEAWVNVLDKEMCESDELVLDEIRHQIKQLLLDNTHDIYLKAVSVSSSMAMTDK
jgi:hypothetical protein